MNSKNAATVGWIIIIAAACLFFSTFAHDSGGARLFRLILALYLLIVGIFILILYRSGHEYWRSTNPKKLAKIKKKMLAETDFKVLYEIARSAPSSDVQRCARDVLIHDLQLIHDFEKITQAASKAPVAEVREEASKRRFAMLRETLENGGGALTLRKAVEIVVNESVDNISMRELLRLSAEKHPEITRERLGFKVGMVSTLSAVASHVDFLAVAASLYPDIVRSNMDRINASLHSDHNRHNDVPTGYHVDQNFSRSHQDSRIPYSDCHDDSHSDSSTHSDCSNSDRLAPLKPYIG